MVKNWLSELAGAGVKHMDISEQGTQQGLCKEKGPGQAKEWQSQGPKGKQGFPRV